MTRATHRLPAALRAAVELQHEIAVGDLALDAAMLRIAERTLALTGAAAAHVTMLDGDELVTGASVGPRTCACRGASRRKAR
jgi:uncharacterized ferredoxin-like protein